MLLNEEATYLNVKIALESFLSRAEPDDMIVLYWAGHAFPYPADTEKTYFAVYDTNSNPTIGFRMDKVLNYLTERNTRNVLIFADMCHAGKLITRGNKRGVEIKPYMDTIIQKMNIPKRWIYMLGAESDKLTLENMDSGIFTHLLIKAFSGGADGFKKSGLKDGIITMNEVKYYLKKICLNKHTSTTRSRCIRLSVPPLLQRISGICRCR